MAKTKTRFVCQACGFESLQWLGKCGNCGGWNTFAEEKEQIIKTQLVRPAISTKAIPLTEVDITNAIRITTGIKELDRVLGGGFCTGSVTLVGGDPGIGKSTLALQIATALAAQNCTILYISGEESAQQIKARAERLKAVHSSIHLLTTTNTRDIEKAITENDPTLVVIDSIQTMYHPDLPSAPGTVGQVRESAAALIRLAKEQGVSILFVGHVTKDGMIAGPKVLEHMVDTVLYFEGERHQQYRIIRSIKNRFGSTNEIGIFDMQADGLIEVTNPSQLFLHDSDLAIPGTMTVALMEGTRSLLVEVQALVTRSPFGMPRRTTTGVDVNRAMLLIAVLEKKCGLHLNTEDVFINVAGGMSIDDPGADLGIALAIASSLKEHTFDRKICAIGEIGLGGELRSVTHCERRVQEAEKLGFTACIIPQANFKGLGKTNIELIPARTVAEVLAKILL